MSISLVRPIPMALVNSGLRLCAGLPAGMALIACLAGLPLATVAADAATPQEIALDAGTQGELLIEAGVARLAVGDDAVASVLVVRSDAVSDSARLIVTAKAPGSTTLMVWRRGAAKATTYRVVVQRRQAVVEGALPNMESHARVLRRAQFANADRPPVDQSIVDVRSQTVQVEVKIVEFSRTVLKEAGINLSSYGPNSHGFSFRAASATSMSQALNLVLGFGNANKSRGMELTLRLLESNGLARVLAEPTLVALSGQSANFLSGGELPIPVPQGLGATTIQYKPFGIGLTVTPTVLSNERIFLKVAPEASDLDYSSALSIEGVPVPSITTRRADTAVELGDGESFIIGGLVSRSTLSNASKVPLLGDIPVIGMLFKQQNYRMTEKELVILVTPHLVRPVARGVDLSSRLPTGGERVDGDAWKAMVLGGGARDALPGFSR
jgi:pilus assembly protein CpaC